MRIKICGVTTVTDALAAAECGADAVGLNFFPESPRCVSRHVAEEIVGELPPFVEPVAVLVRPQSADLRWCLSSLGLRSLQLHGFDSRSEGIAPAFSKCHLIVAFPVGEEGDVEAARKFVSDLNDDGIRPSALLVDARVPGQFGGTGKQAPWHLLAGRDFGLPLILAGGLTPENVVEAIRIVRPYAVDVASGVESQPGKKDREKMRRFVVEARRAASELGI
ncbi:MAG: phosphoribosylanthranilate isomerase [Gemmatales bacterium]|nr:phosphoribosylanthranilate isomerase [Gemmatales bacterium]MDW8385499.1 phosphoribosylanthranilate isomerase [Gemmatales bacterium]